MKCARYDDTCRCSACADDRKTRALEKARTEWRPQPVKRGDSGGTLYAPVDRSGAESGHTPSYNADLIQQFCDELNAREVRIIEATP